MGLSIAQMQQKFNLSFDDISTLSAPEYTPEAIDILLNEAQDDLINDLTNQGLEENQTYTDYLANLVQEVTLTAFTPGNKPYSKFINLPGNYRKMLLERVLVYYPDCVTLKSGELTTGKYIVTSGSITYNNIVYPENSIFDYIQNISTFTDSGVLKKALSKISEVKPETRDRYNKILLNPFKTPYEDLIIRLEYSQGLPIGPQQYELISSKNIFLQEYYIDYYKDPVQMRYGTQYQPQTTDINCELSTEACNMIVQKAVTKAKKIIQEEYQAFKQEEISNTIRP